MRALTLLLAGVLAVGLLLAGCTVTGTVYARRQDRKDVPVSTTPTVVVDTFNGRISVIAAGSDQVEIRVNSRGSGSDQAEAERDLANVAVDITQVGDRVTITAHRKDAPTATGDSGADVELYVPPDAHLELRTSNARVEATNVTGSVLARTSNGSITTRGGDDLDLDTSNGEVSVNGPTGELVVRTSNGALDINNARDVSVTAETSNAPLTFSGSLAPGAHTLETSNGPVSLTLPGDAAFTVAGTTSNGSVRTDFPRLVIEDTSIRGTTGISSVTVVHVTTSNGDLSVMQQRP
jgi:ribosomal protein S11